MENDVALLDKYVANRDAEAFAALANRYACLVYNAALRVTGNAHDAEEVAQECFLTLARQAGSVRSSLPGWLYSLAVSRAKDSVRSNRRRRKHESAREVHHMSENSEPTWTEIAPHVDDAIAELPEELREAVVLHFLQARSQAEIAAQEGVNQSTVSRRIEKAVEALRAALRKRGVVVAATPLALLLVSRAVDAVPLTLTAGLGKMAAAGAGAPAKIVAASWTLKLIVTGLAAASALVVGAILIAPRSKAGDTVVTVQKSAAAPTAVSVIVASVPTASVPATTLQIIRTPPTSPNLPVTPAVADAPAPVIPPPGKTPQPEKASTPDSKVAVGMIGPLYEQFQSVRTSVNDGDSKAALETLKVAIPKMEELVANLKGTTAEKPVSAGIAQVLLVRKAIENGDLVTAKKLLDGINGSGPGLEIMIRQTANEGARP